MVGDGAEIPTILPFVPAPLLFLLGLAALLALIVDAGWTTLWPDRSGGPFSSRAMAWAWRYASNAFTGRHLVLSLLGPTAVALVLLFWVVLLWLGWSLIFIAGGGTSVVHTISRAPASTAELIYFAGYTIFTLGNGDFSPNGAGWQITTAVASGSGLVLISLAITYLVSVLSAVVNKRTFAARVHAFGETPQAFLMNAWDRHAFTGLDLVLSSLATELARLGTQHLAYPVIHFYHPVGRRGSSAVAVALLDEAVTLLSCAVVPAAQPSKAVLHSVRGAVESYLQTLEGGPVKWADAPPPVPELAPMLAAGIPTTDRNEYRTAIEAASNRRKKLRGLVESDHWEWQR